MKKNIFRFIYFIFCSFIFSEELIIQIPTKNKVFSEKNLEYRITTDSENRIIQILCIGGNYYDCKIYYENESFSIIRESNEKKIEKQLNKNVQIYLKDGFTCLDFDHNNIFSYKIMNRNGLTYIVKRFADGTECFDARISYKQVNEKITASYRENSAICNQIPAWSCYGDFETTFSEMQILTDEKTKLQNLTILSEYSEMLTFILFPFFSNCSIEPQRKFTNFSSSSHLVEKNAIYKASNLSDISGLPWASANGYGINDKIIFKVYSRFDMVFNFYNGFINEREDYYKKNSRAKLIKIRCIESEVEKNFTLKDTPEKQSIVFFENRFNSDDNYYALNDYGLEVTIEIEILSIYPGEKYKDLCIQAIVPEY